MGTSRSRALRSGEARLRQRPGARNALGGVKFVLPNTMDIYLHATPARELFERTRRDFSHGCIRVREPEALAQFVLQGQPEWTTAQIEAAMTSGVNRTVPLAAPIPVIVFYTTVIVDAEGRALFLPDIYGHDRKLRALRAAAATGTRASRRAPPRAGALPAPDPAGIEMHELRLRVEPDAAGAQRRRGIAQIGKRNVGEPDVDRTSVEMKAVRGHATAALAAAARSWRASDSPK